MFIKTVSTTSGINPIKFDETGGVLYGLLTLDGGSSTNNFSGDFQFNGKDYWGFAYSNGSNNFVLKL